MLKRSDMRAYQERATQFIKDTPACALWLDMGLGKSVATLTALREMIDSHDVGNTLIIAPLRVARKTWPDEIAGWEHTTGLTYSYILGSAQERLLGLRARADIHLINRENVPWLFDQFAVLVGKRYKQIKKWPWDTVVIDESASFKDNSSVRVRRMKLLRKLFDRCIELTGTPSPNSFADLWSQIYLLDRGERLGRTITEFRDRWFDHNPYIFKWLPRPYAVDQIKTLIADIVVSMRAEDYLELPPVMNNFIPVNLTTEQWKKYRQLEVQSIAAIAGRTVTAVNGAVLAGKLLQLAQGAVYTVDRAWVVFHEAKLEALQEVLEGIYGPVLVAYTFKHDLARIRPLLRKLKIAHAEIRDKGAEAAWDAGKLKVLLLHPDSAGEGLNLHKSGACDIVWFGLPWSLKLYQQANARLAGGHRRVGRNVVVHHIIAQGTMDEVVVAALSAKDAQQELLLNSLKEIVYERSR